MGVEEMAERRPRRESRSVSKNGQRKLRRDGYQSTAAPRRMNEGTERETLACSAELLGRVLE